MSAEVMVTHEVTQFKGSNLVFGLLEELYSLSNKALYAKFIRVSAPGVRGGGERTSGQEPQDQERAEKENNNVSLNQGAIRLYRRPVCFSVIK